MTKKYAVVLSVLLECVSEKIFSVVGLFHENACELSCVWMTVNTMNGMTPLRDCGKDVYCRRFFAMYFSPHSDTFPSAKLQ